MNISTVVLVFIGGGLGSLLRYFISLAVRPLASSIPYATLIANLLGCFIIGVFLGFLPIKPIPVNNTYFLFAVGFCGGLTTFSTFTLENMRFLEQGQLAHFLFYTLISFALGLGLMYLGMLLHRLF